MKSLPLTDMSATGAKGAQSTHSTRPPRERIPRFLLQVMAAMVLASLALAVFARLTDRPLEATPPPAEILRERFIILSGTMSGEARVFDLSGHLIANLNAQQGGFVAGVYRSIARARGKSHLSEGLPVILTHYDDGRLAIHDPYTDWTAQLRGFGQDNFEAFMRILDAPKIARSGAGLKPFIDRDQSTETTLNLN